jgi:hypothetical protein
VFFIGIIVLSIIGTAIFLELVYIIAGLLAGAGFHLWSPVYPPT